MKKILLLVISLGLNLLSFSQKSYNELIKQKGNLVFSDDFSYNSNNWPIKSYHKFQDGKLVFNNINDKTSFVKGTTIDYNRDFIVETSIKLIKKGSNGYGLAWDYKDADNKKLFYIDCNQEEVLICGYAEGKYVPYTDWTKDFKTAIKPMEFNKYSIIKKGNSLLFYVNGYFINEIDFERPASNNWGYQLNHNIGVEIDYFRINYLNTKQNVVAQDNTPPEITITYPNVSRGFKPIEKAKQVTITGKAADPSGIFEILVNGQEASVDAQGNFSKTVLLAYGDNSFTVTAVDLKQNQATKTFIIERQASQQDPVVVNKTNTNVLQTGKYYALIIGNNTYQDPSITSLDKPIQDASKLYNVLTTEYTFEPQNVTFLKNATYIQMIEAFDKLSDKITEKDNLLVFYAGHGWWDEAKNLGYWLPSNAKKSSTAFWIRNSTISDYMSSIKTKHTLLIADACFSGSIFKTRAAFSDAGQGINSLYAMPSRTAMTSGNLKEVPDKSVFLEYLVKRLENNSQKYLPADKLFVSFRIAVMNNSQTEPQFGTIRNAGDEGGEFIFIRK